MLLKSHKSTLLKLLLLPVMAVSLINCGGGSLEDIANDNLYGYKVANETKVPYQAQSGYKDVTLKFNDGEQDLSIHGWYYVKSRYAPTVIYLHGNATNIGSLYNGGIIDALKSFNANVLVIDFPSYGKSTGLPNMQSLTTSAGQAIKWVNNNFPDSKIILWGRSLGAGVASQATDKYKHFIDGTVLTSPWLSVDSLIEHHFSALKNSVPDEWFEANKYESNTALQTTELPGLIFHGDTDSVIPYKFGVQLHEAIEKKLNVEFVTLTGLGHNDIFTSQQMWADIKTFVHSL